MATQAAKVRNEEGQGGGQPFRVPGPLQNALDYPKRFRQFLHEVRVEMKQVTWPTWDDVKSTTLVVIATVAFFGLYFFVVDSGVAYMVQEVFKLFKK